MLGAHPTPVGEEAAQSLVGPTPESRRQVHDEQVHGAPRQQARREAEALLEVGRTDDEQPAQVHPSSDRLDRVEEAKEAGAPLRSSLWASTTFSNSARATFQSPWREAIIARPTCASMKPRGSCPAAARSAASY